MRRSRFTENEILHLLYEASTGVSAAEICRTARISLRTLYRWRRRFGGLDDRIGFFAGLVRLGGGLWVFTFGFTLGDVRLCDRANLIETERNGLAGLGPGE